MSRFEQEALRQNYTLTQAGKEYNLRLLQRSQAIFTGLLNLLPSNYVSSVQGPAYTQEIKAVAVELARLELAIEDVHRDRSFPDTRSDFLYSIVGYMVLLNGRLPSVEFDDAGFKQFLLDLVRIYFKGSVPGSIRDGVALFISDNVKVTENFLLIRSGGSGLDISDQYGFQIDIEAIGGVLPPDLFALDGAIRMILDVIRPAHTLYRLRYIFSDAYAPGTQGKVQDALRSRLGAYYYDDIRKYTGGVAGLDRLGAKNNQLVTGESHTGDF